MREAPIPDEFKAAFQEKRTELISCLAEVGAAAGKDGGEWWVLTARPVAV